MPEDHMPETDMRDATDLDLDSGGSDRDAGRDGDPGAGTWARVRAWSARHRGPLLALGAGVTTVAVGVWGRRSGSASSVLETAAAVAQDVAAVAAEASERVYAEFQALGRDYNMAAMDQTVGQAVRRHQRWTPEELDVLRDAGKTALEKALELGRTYNGVMAKAIKEGASSRTP